MFRAPLARYDGQAAKAEATVAQRFFLAMGIASDRLVLEDQSANTRDNAEMTAEMLGTSTGTALLAPAFHAAVDPGCSDGRGLITAWPTVTTVQDGHGFGFHT
jgi:hypothetical protein